MTIQISPLINSKDQLFVAVVLVVKNFKILRRELVLTKGYNFVGIFNHFIQILSLEIKSSCIRIAKDSGIQMQSRQQDPKQRLA